jgi:hypothetical protein
MIKYIDKDDTFMGVITALKQDTFLTKISIVYKAYGISKYADFWYQYRNEKYTSMLMRVGGDFVLYLSDESDMYEISEFLKVVGFNRVLYNAEYKLSIDNIKENIGVIMKLSSGINGLDGNIGEENNYKEVYGFFKGLNSKSLELPEYGDFVTDLYSKVRCKLTKVKSIYNDNKIVSCCITVSDNINTIVNAVGTDKNYRNKDYAKNLIHNMKGENTYLYCNDDIHTVIYEKMGFKTVGKWKEIYR